MSGRGESELLMDGMLLPKRKKCIDAAALTGG